MCYIIVPSLFCVILIHNIHVSLEVIDARFPLPLQLRNAMKALENPEPSIYVHLWDPINVVQRSLMSLPAGIVDIGCRHAV